MPLFGSSSMFDPEVEKATDECNTAEDWQAIMDICDKMKTSPNGPKEGMRAIMKRISHVVPHVSMQALTLLSACVNNCGKPFQLELCSRNWINEARVVIQRGHPKVSEKLKELIEQWAEEFKNDPQLNLLPQFYRKLKSEGISFSKSEPDTKVKSKKEELEFKEDIDLAIALSLHDSAPVSKGSTQNYNPPASSPAISAPEREPRKARALYDFEAAEDNELSFKSGEIILVSDDSDQNWWKGQGTRGEGLFPANFVTTDLTQPPPATRPKVVISEEKLESCLAMLKNASPTEEEDEEETIREYEENCMEMAPLIEKKITNSERKQLELNELNQKFIQAITMYQQSMKEPLPAPTIPAYNSPQMQYQGMPGYSSPYQQAQAQPQMYSGAQMPPGSMQGNLQYSSMVMGQPVSMDAAYSSQGPPSIGAQPQFQGYSQDIQQNTGYQDAGYYMAASTQDSYAQSRQTAAYDYNQQQQQQQLYSQAAVYQ
eukprot:gene8417-14398_t